MVVKGLTGSYYVDDPKMSTMHQTPSLNIHVCQGCPPCPNPLSEYLHMLRILRFSKNVYHALNLLSEHPNVSNIWVLSVTQTILSNPRILNLPLPV